MEPLCLLTVLRYTDRTRLYYPRESISCSKAITEVRPITLRLIGRIARARARLGVHVKRDGLVISGKSV
jgi:hypothetical protein